MNRIFFLLFFYSVTQVNAQKVDSLWRVYNSKNVNDSIRYVCIVKIINAIQKTDIDSAIHIIDGCIEITQLHNDMYYEAKLYREKSYLLEKKKLYNDALFFLNRATSIFKSLNKPIDEGNCYLSLHLLYLKKSNYKQVLNCGLKALELFKTHNDSIGIGMAYNNLGLFYYQQKQYKQSLNFFFKSIPYREKKNLAKVFANIASAYKNLNEINNAKKYFQKAILLSKKYNYKAIEAGCYNNLGNLYKKLNVDSSQMYFNEGIKIAIEDKNAYVLSNCYSNNASLLNSIKQYEKAFNLAKKADSIAKINDLTDAEITNLKEISLACEGLKNYQTALAYRKQYERLNDSIYNIENSKLLSDLKTNYEVEQKEKELKEVASRKQMRLLWQLSAIALTIIFIVLIFYYKNKQKQIKNQLEKNELKQKLLLTQMNPHFIFNSVTHIQGLIDDNQNKEAVLYLNGFSSLTRQILQNSTQSYISLTDEINMLQNYLNIQKQLHNHSFSFSIHTDETINQEYYFIPPMLLQPFIENSIKHGIDSNAKKGHITISIKRNNNVLIAEITDNGKGFINKEANLKSPKHQSMAVSITQQRLINYEQTKNKTICFENILNSEQKIIGAKVQFEIPYLYEND